MNAAGSLTAILWGGLVAGVLDITDAFVFFGFSGIKPIRLLQGIASGLLGPRAFQGGWKTAALGMLFHFVIAYSAATVYYAVSRKVGFLIEHWLICGLAYGLGVYLFMNLIVLPLSSVNRAPMTTLGLVNGVLAIVLLVGLPIAFIVARYSR